MPKGRVVNVKYRLRGERVGSTMLVDMGKEANAKVRGILARYLNVRDENVIVLGIKDA